VGKGTETYKLDNQSFAIEKCEFPVGSESLSSTPPTPRPVPSMSSQTNPMIDANALNPSSNAEEQRSDSVSSKFNMPADKSQSLAWAVNASWAVNWFLLVGKAIVVILSNSKAMTAALVDSAVDLLSQFILSLAERYMSKHSEKYPVGRSRLEALSVIACSFIMTMASIEGK
jgi:hypothetical protein